MELEEILSAEERAHLDFAALADFWQSLIGAGIRSHARNVRRELAFTARFSPAELPGHKIGDLADDEFVVWSRARRIWPCCCRKKSGWLISRPTK